MIPTQTLDEFLDEQGYKGQLQEALYNYLEDLGLTGTLNEKMYKWLKQLGYEGTLPEMLFLWLEEFIPVPQIQWVINGDEGSLSIVKMTNVPLLQAVGGENSLTIIGTI